MLNSQPSKTTYPASAENGFIQLHNNNTKGNQACYSPN